MSRTTIAEFWSQMEDSWVQCELCPHRCLIPQNDVGLCFVRGNHNGTLIAAGYGQISSLALDPIEKKPLRMFMPGKQILSIGSFGCNLHCPFCQNSAISMEFASASVQSRWQNKVATPDDIVMLAKEAIAEGNIGIAYTYNEPMVGYEFMRDTAQLAHESELCNVIVTNGYINKEPLEALLPVIDAMNIDLKGFSNDFYKKVGGDLEKVKNTITLSRKYCHVEVAVLVIPSENENDICDLAMWLASIDSEIPLHLLRFFPRFRYADKTPTSRELVYDLSERAKKYLKNVFIGNM